jgi:hypothetical protein
MNFVYDVGKSVCTARWYCAPKESPFCSVGPLSRAVLKTLLPALVGTPSGTENGRSFLLTAGNVLRHAPIGPRPRPKQVAILNDLRAPSAKRTAVSGGVKMNRQAFWWYQFWPQEMPTVTRQSGPLHRERADIKTAPQSNGTHRKMIREPHQYRHTITHGPTTLRGAARHLFRCS